MPILVSAYLLPAKIAENFYQIINSAVVKTKGEVQRNGGIPLVGDKFIRNLLNKFIVINYIRRFYFILTFI